MAKYQLGRPLPPEDLASIVRFLQTLTGEYEGKPLSL
jgi:cytochrome c peroxidase